MDAFDVLILVLRIGFIFLLYFFLFLVVRVITRELDSAKSRSRSVSPAPAAVYPEEGLTGIQEAVGQPGKGLGRLVITEIGNATTVRPGAVFELGPITPIGRKAINAIRLDDDFVSGEHALLAWREGRWYLSDVASTNGTFLNGEQVSQPRPVHQGDLIGIGRVRLRLEP
jgi:pSer/pThr/pTyr-binding forkhead associated (FHA) protein